MQTPQRFLPLPVLLFAIFLLPASVPAADKAAPADPWDAQRVELLTWDMAGTRANLDGRTLFAGGTIQPRKAGVELKGLRAWVNVYGDAGEFIKRSDNTAIGDLSQPRTVRFLLPACPVFERIVLVIKGRAGAEEFENEFHGYGDGALPRFEPSGVIPGQSFPKVVGRQSDYSQSQRAARVIARIQNKGELPAEGVVLDVQFLTFTGKDNRTRNVVKKHRYEVKEKIESGKTAVVTFFVVPCPAFDSADVLISPESFKSAGGAAPGGPAAVGPAFPIDIPPQPGKAYVEKCVVHRTKGADGSIEIALKNEMDRAVTGLSVTVSFFDGNQKKIRDLEITLAGTLPAGQSAPFDIPRNDIPDFCGAGVSLKYNFVE